MTIVRHVYCCILGVDILYVNDSNFCDTQLAHTIEWAKPKTKYSRATLTSKIVPDALKYKSSHQIAYEGIKMHGGSFVRDEPEILCDKEHRNILRGRMRKLSEAKPKVVVMHMGVNDLRSLGRKGQTPEQWFQLILKFLQETHALFKG
jgi:hypothetical protein